MKLKNWLISLSLCFCSVFALFGLSGCGNVSLKTVENSFQKLADVYASYSTVFKNGECSGMSTNYLISYGSTVDDYVSSDKSGYVELESVYNTILVVSSDYIDNNKEYVTNLIESELKKSSKSALSTLNASIISYTKAIDEFVVARQNFVDSFEQFGATMPEESSFAYLRKFKKVYGNLVSKNIELSMDLASVIETTDIFDLLQSTEPTINDTKIVKEYLRAKMLPVFSQFMITEIENNLNWSVQPATETKTRVDNMLTSLKNSFESYKTNFVGRDNNKAIATQEDMNDLFTLIKNFLAESDDYITALKKVKISKLAVDFDNDLSRYEKSNPLASVYLTKIEQFVGTILPDFMTQVIKTIY